MKIKVSQFRALSQTPKVYCERDKEHITYFIQFQQEQNYFTRSFSCTPAFTQKFPDFEFFPALRVQVHPIYLMLI